MFYAQDKTETRSVGSATITPEQIYLQLNNLVFSKGEQLWFKAIVTDADTKPSSVSKVLYVELISPKKKVIDRKLVKIERGVGAGNFDIYDTYTNGEYRIRAYTQWNHNFKPNPMFRQQIQIITKERKTFLEAITDVKLSPRDTTTSELSFTITPNNLDNLHQGSSVLYVASDQGKDSLNIEEKYNTGFNYTQEVPKDAAYVHYRLETDNQEYQQTIVLTNDIRLQFFPEGGGLVMGLESIVGFKAQDVFGKGVQTKGNIVDENDSLVGSFTSNPLGMGKFSFLPRIGKTYRAIIKRKDGTKQHQLLPKALTEGAVLQLSEDALYFKLFVQLAKKQSDSLYLILKHRGKVTHVIPTKLNTEGQLKYAVRKDILGNGVHQLTLLNKRFVPLSERLFYHHRPASTPTFDMVKLESESNVKVQLSLNQFSDSVDCSTSVLVVDSLLYGRSKQSILSYFLLESKIKGTLDNPNYYFKEGYNKEAMDALLLTQGWRNYKLNDSIRAKGFRPEKGLNITGKLMFEGNRKIKGTKLQLYAGMDRYPEVYEQKLDSTGTFGFSIADDYNYAKQVFLQVLAKGKAKVPRITFNDKYIPEVADMTYLSNDDYSSFVLEKKREVSKTQIAEQAFEIDPNAVKLDETVVSAYRISPKRKEMIALHGYPDSVLESEELENKRADWMSGIYSLLLARYPNLVEVNRIPNTGMLMANIVNMNITLVVVDGIAVGMEDYPLIQDISISEVTSVELFRDQLSVKDYFFDVARVLPPPDPNLRWGMIAIYTRSGTGLFGAMQKTKNVFNHVLETFAPVKEFYQDASNDELLSSNNKVPTLFWKSSIDFDDEGNYTFDFVNSNPLRQKTLILECITSKGTVHYKTFSLN